MGSPASREIPALALPFELQKRIAIRCHRSDIARLARIHTFWTAPCEEALYEQVTLYQYSANGFVATITSNSRKAALVLALYIRTAFERGQETSTVYSTLFRDALEHLCHLRFLKIPVLEQEESNRLAALMRGGGLNTLRGLRMYSGHSHDTDVFLDLQAAILSLSATLRVIALCNDGYLRESLLEPFTTAYSVMVEYEAEDSITLYPQLYCGPRRATYLDDCVWAVNSALFRRDFNLSFLEIRTDDLAAVGDVLHAVAGDLPALRTLHVSFAAPGKCELLDAARVAAALRPVAARILTLTLGHDQHRSVQIAVPNVEFAKQLVDAGCTGLTQLRLLDGNDLIRSEQGHWS